jgi:hypothetical protein
MCRTAGITAVEMAVTPERNAKNMTIERRALRTFSTSNIEIPLDF